jgi:hypothetical protein
MAANAAWWDGDDEERCWLVIEHRELDYIDDPLTVKRDRGGRTPRLHGMVTKARVGNVVFHYGPWQQAIANRSRVIDTVQWTTGSVASGMAASRRRVSGVDRCARDQSRTHPNPTR